MPTTYEDQFWLIDPFNPPPAGSTLNVLYLALVDQDSDGRIDRFNADSIDGSDIRSSYPGDTVTISLAGGGTATITGTTFYLADGREVFTPTDGSVLQNATLQSATYVSSQGPLNVGSLGPPCFLAGTRITTERGKRPVEKLKPGHVIIGVNGERLPLLKVLRRSFSTRDLRDNPKLFPVMIKAGALGGGLPKRDLLVSKQHRMLIRSKISERMFGDDEVLIPAIKLTPLPGIYVDKSVRHLDYYHLLFEKHEVILAENAPTESLLTGQQALSAIDPEAREEILFMFPEVEDEDYVLQTSRHIPQGKRQKNLIERHLKNNRALLGGKLKAFADE